jgi:phosphoadenosine phosphosulfate reductase
MSSRLCGPASANFAEKLAHTITVLKEASALPRTALATSLGAEDMVLTDLIAREGLTLGVFMLNTGRLHAQTLALADQVNKAYAGKLKIEVYEPLAPAVEQYVRVHGRDAFYESVDLRKACCAMRKTEPLKRALSGRAAWVTGLRRAQSTTRTELAEREYDAGNGLEKFNPLADWTEGDVWHYIDTYSVPYNTLHDQFYPSIGCEPCTRAISHGEDVRAGRWWWEDPASKECGLHVAEHAKASTLTPTLSQAWERETKHESPQTA